METKNIQAPENLQIRIDELNDRRKANFGNIGSLMVCGIITQSEYNALGDKINAKYDQMIAESRAMQTPIKH